MAIGTPVERKALSSASLSTSTWVITPDSTITAGTVALLCFTSAANKVITGITDAAGNTWTVDNSGGDGTRTWVFASCQVATTITTSTNITMTMSNTTSSEANVWIEEVSGLVSSSVADACSGNNGTGTSVHSGPTGTLAQANEIALGLFRTAVSVSWTKGSAWTDVSTPTLGSTSALEYQIVSSTASISATGTFGGAGNLWVGSIQTYKGAAGGGDVTVTVPGPASATGSTVVDVPKVDVVLTYTIR